MLGDLMSGLQEVALPGYLWLCVILGALRGVVVMFRQGMDMQGAKGAQGQRGLKPCIMNPHLIPFSDPSRLRTSTKYVGVLHSARHCPKPSTLNPASFVDSMYCVPCQSRTACSSCSHRVSHPEPPAGVSKPLPVHVPYMILCPLS